MARQYPIEIFIGQKVLVRFDAGSHPIEALVTALDTVKGLVHVAPIGYRVKWAARPRAICSDRGLFLHFEDDHFFFSKLPCFS